MVGYDYDLGKLVVGLEGEIDGSTAKKSEANVVALGDKVEVKAGRDLYVGARAGFKVTPRVLVYAKGGYTNARINAAYTDASNVTIEDHADLNGFRVGAGVEVKTGPFAICGEYRYSDYSDYTYQGFNTGVSARRHQLVATAVAKF